MRFPRRTRRAAPRPRRLHVVVAALVALVGLAVTAFVGVRLADRPGVYWASQRVGILAPRSTENPNILQLSLRSINMTAGFIAQLVSEDHRAERPVEPEMSLANIGITSGWSVEQPDRGGQWSHQYSDPYITIQVADPDPERVEQLMTTLEQRVKTTISEIQDEAGVAPVNRFTTTTSPPDGQRVLPGWQLVARPRRDGPPRRRPDPAPRARHAPPRPEARRPRLVTSRSTRRRSDGCFRVP